MDRAERFMRRALKLAARGRTSPNPQVGAVIVNQGEIVGEGYHQRCGEAHAEVNALADAGERARGGELFVTLEPCNHQGRTPPCTEAVIGAGLARVYVGALDPDEDVAGGGVKRLQEAGIIVEKAVLGEQCQRFYEAYSTHRRLRRPHVTLKAGMSLDGRLATRTGHSRWVTGPEARRAVHRLRHETDAIMVGIGTVLADDPQLTTRLPRGRAHDPVRVVVDSSARTPLKAKLVTQRSDASTIVAHTARGRAAAAALAERGVISMECREKEGRVDLADLLRQLAERGIVTLLVEGGGELHWSLLNAGLADRVKFFVAPVIIGGREAIPAVAGRGAETMLEAWGLEGLAIQRFGDDLLLEGRVIGRRSETERER